EAAQYAEGVEEVVDRRVGGAVGDRLLPRLGDVHDRERADLVVDELADWFGLLQGGTVGAHAIGQLRDADEDRESEDADAVPSRPASSHVGGLVAAAQMGGWGFWTGFGITSRAGMRTYLPAYSNGDSVHMRGMISSDSCHMSRDSAVSISKPACSNWLERPVPNSTRPFETMSSAATRSATRIGGLNL